MSLLPTITKCWQHLITKTAWILTILLQFSHENLTLLILIYCKTEDSKRLASFQIPFSQNRSKFLHGFDTKHMYLKKKSVWNRYRIALLRNCIVISFRNIIFSKYYRPKTHIFEINKIFKFEKQIISKFFDMYFFQFLFTNFHNIILFVRNLHIITYFDKIIFLHYDIYAEINL